MPGPDANDWLHRLSTDEWLAAAATELAHAQATLERRAYRPAVTHARRAAGMALNAVLTLRPRPAWGRSYMEHVAALADDADVPAPMRAAADRLRATPAAPPELVRLGAPDATALDAARSIIAWARAEVASLRGPVS